MPPKINFVERNKQNIASKKTAVKKEVVDKDSGASKDKEKEKENKPVRTSSAATSRPRPLAKTNSSRPVSAPVKPKSITKCFAHQYKYFFRCSNLVWYQEKAINCD